MTKPLVSIVTVNYNNLEGLVRTGKSIAELSMGSYEWIVVDGMSTDGSADFIREASPDKCIIEADRGIYDAMNKGLSISEGVYVIFMNSGDEFYSSQCLDFLASIDDDRRMIVGDANFFEGQSSYRFYSRVRSKFSFVRQNPFCHQSIFYNTACLKSLGGYDLGFRISADFDLTLKYFLTYGALRHDGLVCSFALGGVGGRNQYQSLRDRLVSIERLDKILFVFALLAVPFVLFKFLVVGLLDKVSLLWVYRRLRASFRRVIGHG